ncbi:hypothetical protein [Aeromicrobium sp. Leaf350]|uniref:hypothetical protein n=1 Tax=Aeromicrobium sp. Leaf350 TaxID=2876565 RepID=UPI001E628A89|nr:hypothetical protein [Aeromicrobium sp. Leaf350]
MPLRVATGHVFSDATEVFAFSSYGDQAVLSSSLHQLWAITYGSGMRNDPRYTPSDVFETFPRPVATTLVEEAGRSLDHFRRDVMLRRNLGLTKLYNLVNDPEVAGTKDPEIAGIRQAHVDLDAAVLDAYGWNDLDPQHGFHEYRKMLRWSLSPLARVEALDRLLEENHRRKKNEGAGAPATRSDGAGAEAATLFD